MNPQPPVLETGALPIELRSLRAAGFSPRGCQTQDSCSLCYFRLSLWTVCLRSRLQYLDNSIFGVPPKTFTLVR